MVVQCQFWKVVASFSCPKMCKYCLTSQVSVPVEGVVAQLPNSCCFCWSFLHSLDLRWHLMLWVTLVIGQHWYDSEPNRRSIGALGCYVSSSLWSDFLCLQVWFLTSTSPWLARRASRRLPKNMPIQIVKLSSSDCDQTSWCSFSPIFLFFCFKLINIMANYEC